MHNACIEVLHNSHTMCTSGSSDMSTLSPRATDPLGFGCIPLMPMVGITIKYIILSQMVSNSDK